MSNATPVTTETLENLTHIAALVQRHKPALDPLDVSKGVTKLQKLSVSLRKQSANSQFGPVALRAANIAEILGIVFNYDASSRPPVCSVTIGDWTGRI